MSYRSYTLEKVKEVKSCTDLLKLFVEQYVSPRERVRIMLGPVRDLIRDGLQRKTPRAKLLSLVNASDEVKESNKITPFQFRRYLLEEFPELVGGRNASAQTNKRVGGALNAEEFRIGVTKKINERRNPI
jgi:hypothetical protein